MSWRLREWWHRPTPVQLAQQQMLESMARINDLQKKWHDRWLEESMSLRTITIEVKVNVDDRQYEAARKLARRCAQQLHAGAMLLSDKRVEVAVYGKDFHTGQIDIPLTEDEDVK